MRKWHTLRAVLLGYMAMRKALDEYGTLDRQVRTAILVAVAAADECAYSMPINTLVVQQSGWRADQVPMLRNADAADPKLAALLRLARRSALNHGPVDEPTWQAARAGGLERRRVCATASFGNDAGTRPLVPCGYRC